MADVPAARPEDQQPAFPGPLCWCGARGCHDHGLRSGGRVKRLIARLATGVHIGR